MCTCELIGYVLYYEGHSFRDRAIGIGRMLFQIRKIDKIGKFSFTLCFLI
jgi:hypothetical protein